MNRPGIEIVRVPIGLGWVTGALSLAPAAKAALLVVPPFFHEWQRGYRLFALLADALAQRGVSVLRFDYRGCGESSGADEDFLPSRALEDADSALGLLRSRCGAPAVLLGVRGGALLAERLAHRRALPWWAWQVVDDGRSHLDALRERDLREINNRNRFPFLARTVASDPSVLMGHRVHPEFALELGIFKRASEPAWRIDAASGAHGDALALPPEFSAWVGQIDLQGSLPLAAIAALAERMAERLPARTDAAA